MTRSGDREHNPKRILGCRRRDRARCASLNRRPETGSREDRDQDHKRWYRRTGARARESTAIVSEPVPSTGVYAGGLCDRPIRSASLASKANMSWARNAEPETFVCQAELTSPS